MESLYTNKSDNATPHDDIGYNGPFTSRGYYHVVYFVQHVLLEHFKKPRILVVGYGAGYELVYLIKGDVEVVGLELDIPNVDIIKNKTIVASAESIPFFDKSFDWVFCCETLEHIPMNICKKILREFKRVANNYYLTVATRGDNPWNTHINIRNGEEWIKTLRDMEFEIIHASLAPSYWVKYKQNLIFFDYQDGVFIYGGCKNI